MRTTAFYKNLIKITKKALVKIERVNIICDSLIYKVVSCCVS